MKRLIYLMALLSLLNCSERNKGKVISSKDCSNLESFNFFSSIDFKDVYCIEIMEEVPHLKEKYYLSFLEGREFFELMNMMNSSMPSNEKIMPSKYEIRVWFSDSRGYRFRADDLSFNFYSNSCNFKFSNGFDLGKYLIIRNK